jgi:glucose dehydrogenase
VREAGVRILRLAIALILALVGLVWIGQGIGAIGGSAMSGSPFWAVVGLVLLVAAALVVAWDMRLRSRG